MMNVGFDSDCVLIHTPKAHAHYLPFGDFFHINYAPMGMFALVEWLLRTGWRASMWHAGVQHLTDPTVDLVDRLDGQKIRAIGLSLYWHYQSYDAIEMARALKAAHPEATVFLGGVTASYFAEEILQEFRFIDVILLGHAEGSVPALLTALRDDQGLSCVPDAMYRSPDGTVCNTRGVAYTHRPAVDDLVFGDLSVLDGAEMYASSFGFPLAWGREFSLAENQQMLNMGRPFFPLFTGRGCPYTCTFCGGNQDTLRRINGTSKVQWRSPHKVVDDIRRAMSFGYRTMSLCFDPTPTRDDYYVELFRQVEQARLGVDFYFECWGLPTTRFLDAFRRAFPSPESYVAISPDAGSERVRRINKQPYYSNEEMFAALFELRARDIAFDVFFTLALPGERLDDARRTWELQRHIGQTYENARRVMTWTVQMEPGSPQFTNPERYGIVTDRRTFRDFYLSHRGNDADTYSGLGFRLLDYFGDERDAGTIADFERHLQHLKCMEFCFLAKDPRKWAAPDAGRRHCFERRTALAQRRGTPLPTVQIGEGTYYEDAVVEEERLRGSRPRASWIRSR